MSLQKLTAALVTGSQETNLALAHLNFDFSLIKVDAPLEFRPLGDELTVPRRKAAETGTPHVTARKLGALFQQLIPPTPNLIKAYGRRASEIASSRAVNPKGTKTADGIFADQVGADGTSIWAAATSGPESIALHFLACMLARFWSVSEATSIWAEMVEERKMELERTDETETFYLHSRSASVITLSREQLAEWDASARAWLRAADDGMKVKQKQLMLILNNINIPVNSRMNTYQSVLQAWRSAMITTEKLIKGMPQSVQDGAVLLGISSWHLYPDLVVLGNVSKDIPLHDDLLAPGGILTVGLESNSPEHDSGVYWSLPLGHLRYYGGPVMASKSIAIHGSRISMQQLLQVCVGCLARDWKALDIHEVATTIGQLYDYVSPEIRSTSSSKLLSLRWLQLLASATEPLLGLDDLERKSCMQLIKFGQRRCPNFLSPRSDTVSPLFGITDPKTFIGLLDTAEAKIDVLRRIASLAAKNKDDIFLIRYRSWENNMEYEYATGLPRRRSSSKRTADNVCSSGAGHARWVFSTQRHPYDMGQDLPTFQYAEGTGDDLEPSQSSLSSAEDLGEECFDLDIETIQSFGDEEFIWQNAPSMFSATVSALGDEPSHSSDRQSFRPDRTFRCIAGDPRDAALFVVDNDDLGKMDVSVPLSAIRQSMHRGGLGKYLLAEHFAEFTHHISRDLRYSLRALLIAVSVYKLLPDATISLGVTSQALYKMPWIPKIAINIIEDPIASEVPVAMSWASTFACIALFESGSFAISPASLTSVFAMSVGDSLYVAAPLLCDPCEEPQAHEVRRIRGNVGKPGMAMLIPPQNPRVLDFDFSKWHMVDHADFDGHLEDHFQTTSLHLSFSEYKLPIDVGTHGGRDSEMFFLESLVSVHDRGGWIADLDILGMLSDIRFRRVSRGRCLHARELPPKFSDQQITCIDNWGEFLDRPDNVAIFRSTGNWVARLAATTLNLQLRYPTITLPNRFCSSCVREAWNGIHADLDTGAEQKRRASGTERMEVDSNRSGRIPRNGRHAREVMESKIEGFLNDRDPDALDDDAPHDTDTFDDDECHDMSDLIIVC